MYVRAGVSIANVCVVMEVPERVLAGRVVLVIWHQAHTPEVMQPLLERMMERVGATGRVVVENAERLITG